MSNVLKLHTSKDHQWDEYGVCLICGVDEETFRRNQAWKDRVRTEAAYDASIGHDLDDEGFSFHDYS